jgi:hypothetical protein
VKGRGGGEREGGKQGGVLNSKEAWFQKKCHPNSCDMEGTEEGGVYNCVGECVTNIAVLAAS